SPNIPATHLSHTPCAESRARLRWFPATPTLFHKHSTLPAALRFGDRQPPTSPTTKPRSPPVAKPCATAQSQVPADPPPDSTTPDDHATPPKPGPFRRTICSPSALPHCGSSPSTGANTNGAPACPRD